MADPSQEAMLLYVRSMQSNLEKSAPQHKPEKTSFFSRFSFRKRPQEPKNDVWIPRLSHEPESPRPSFLDRLSFLKSREPETPKLVDEDEPRSPSFLDRLSFLKPRNSDTSRLSLSSRPSPVHFVQKISSRDDDTDSDDSIMSELPSPIADMAIAYLSSPPPPAPRSSDVSVHHTMRLRRLGVPNHAPRHHGGLESSRSSMYKSMRAAQEAELIRMRQEDVNMAINETEVAQMTMEDVNVIQKPPTKPKTVFVIRRAMSPVARPTLQYELVDHETSWFDESWASMRGPNH
ncbi:hypothetical protein AC1031_013019 [Aphanomyces cochlioides]|nr:hypothetical protein AC1031_013019 [Aphanomyces cochlioides]